MAKNNKHYDWLPNKSRKKQDPGQKPVAGATGQDQSQAPQSSQPAQSQPVPIITPPKSQPEQSGLSQDDIDALLSRAAERARKKQGEEPDNGVDAAGQKAGTKTPPKGAPKVEAALGQSYNRVAAEQGVQVADTAQPYQVPSQPSQAKPAGELVLSARDKLKTALHRALQKQSLPHDEIMKIAQRFLGKFSKDTGEFISGHNVITIAFSDLETMVNEVVAETARQTSKLDIEGIEQALAEVSNDKKAAVGYYDPSVEEKIGREELRILRFNNKSLEDENSLYEYEIERLKNQGPGCLSTLWKLGLAGTVIGLLAYATPGVVKKISASLREGARQGARERHKETVVKRDFNGDGLEDKATIYPHLGTRDNDKILIAQKDGSFKTPKQVFEEQLRPYKESHERRLAAIKRKYAAARILAGDPTEEATQKKIQVLDKTETAKLAREKSRYEKREANLKKEQDEELVRINGRVYPD